MGLTIKKPDGTVLSSSEGEGTAQANEQAAQEQGKLVLGRALHLTADGKVVEDDDVAGVTVLGGKGSTMTAAQVERYGLNESHREPSQPSARELGVGETLTTEVGKPLKPKKHKAKAQPLPDAEESNGVVQ